MSTVCGLMSVYSCEWGQLWERFLRQAIESMLVQTRPLDRFVFVADGDKRIIKIAESYRKLDIIYNEKNMGIPYSLNRAVATIEEDYILRSDGDDWSAPDRLEKSLELMETDPKIGAVGDNYGVAHTNGLVYQKNTADPETLTIERMAGAIAGSGSLLRTSVIKEIGCWKERYKYAQDYYLWVKMRKAGYRIVSLKDSLYFYRQHDGQISQAKRHTQKMYHREIIDNEC